jgi:hypothetical protein
MPFSPEILKWESQNWDLCCPKTLDIHIFSNQVYFENMKAISYSPQKDIFNMYNMHQSELIWPLLSRVCGWESNSQFDYCPFLKSELMQIMSKWTMRGHFKHLRFKTFWPNLVFVCLFQRRLWTFVTPQQMQLSKWECTWESLGFIPCILPHFR